MDCFFDIIGHITLIFDDNIFSVAVRMKYHFPNISSIPQMCILEICFYLLSTEIDQWRINWPKRMSLRPELIWNQSSQCVKQSPLFQRMIGHKSFFIWLSMMPQICTPFRQNNFNGNVSKLVALFPHQTLLPSVFISLLITFLPSHQFCSSDCDVIPRFP